MCSQPQNPHFFISFIHRVILARKVLLERRGVRWVSTKPQPCQGEGQGSWVGMDLHRGGPGARGGAEKQIQLKSEKLSPDLISGCLFGVSSSQPSWRAEQHTEQPS